MSITIQVTTSVRNQSGDAAPITGSTSYSGTSEVTADKVIAASTSNSAISMAFAHASVVFGSIIATGDCTLKTNSSGSPVDTIAVTANTPINWTGASGDPFSADVTEWFVTTPAGVAVHFQAMVLLP